MPLVTVVPAAKATVERAALASVASAKEALDELLCQLLESKSPGREDTVLVRALGEEADEIRKPACEAAERMVAGPGLAKASALLAAFESILDHPPSEKARAGRVTGAVLALAGVLAEAVEQDDVASLMNRQMPLLASDSTDLAVGAAKGLACTIRGALRNGSLMSDAELTSLVSTHVDKVRAAASTEESRAAAYALGAVAGGAGAQSLDRLGVMKALLSVLGGKKGAEHARESAVLAIEQLSLRLACDFEPYGVPLLRTLVALYTDKDKKVADAAVRAVRALVSQLSPLAVKLVLPALYDGMEAVQWRTRVECLDALAALTRHAPGSVGPRLPVAIPRVMECLASTNAKVVEAASNTLPLLVQCVNNPETQKLKPLIIRALTQPATTADFIEELLCTTFVNAMDGTSLAFLMPLLLRGLNDQAASLVKKAATASGNVSALVKNPSEIAPFVPMFDPVLLKCCDHSNPDVRRAAERARTKLLEGAGGLLDIEARPKAVAEVLCEQIRKLSPHMPASAMAFVADVCAERLEQSLGGDVKLEYMLAAPSELSDLLTPYLVAHSPAPAAEAITSACEATVAAFREQMSEEAKALLNSSDGKDYAIDVQKVILAFAGRVLLKGCDLRFERGRRYGLIGQNGVGKTTLLNRLAAKDITGFETQLRVWYIRHEVVCEEGVTVRAFAMLQSLKKDPDAVTRTLEELGFNEALQETFVTNLSGGWKMKLSIAISMLNQPELLLLDEPTNHLDANAVEFLTRHLLSLTGVTILVVSHDYGFIENVVTDVAHYDNGGKAGAPCHLKYYPMGFKAFQELNPDIVVGLPTAAQAMATAAALAASESDSASESGSTTSKGDGATAQISRVNELMDSGAILPIRFPDPGKPEGIRTYRKPIMTMKNISYQYEGTDKMVLTDATVTVTLGSRAVLLGANGAGKSTFLKLIVGDLEMMDHDGKGGPPQGESWKHHNLRVSYIAQHSLHHLEEYIEQSPMAYIQERFRHGLDRDVARLKTHLLTDDEKEVMAEIGQVRQVIGRQQRGKQLWYEVLKTGRKDKDALWLPADELEKQYDVYVKKLMKNFDEKQMAIDSGMAIRPITSAEILAHLDDFGIDQELAHGKIKQMSGGQRQRLVISSAFWSKPHLICLDEPTNYLDNDTLAALTQALKNFKGAVITVSHNEAFVAEIANEKWIVEKGQIVAVQLRDAKAR